MTTFLFFNLKKYHHKSVLKNYETIKKSVCLYLLTNICLKR